MRRAFAIGLAVVAAGVVALGANLLLVGYASNRDDPVGKLNPRLVLTTKDTAPTQPTHSTSTSTTTTATAPTTTDDHGGGSGSDDRGGGSNSGPGGGGGDDD